MLDAKSMCPGGKDKQIKDCCPDMVKEIGQIYEMIENEQYAACLNMIERLEKTHPDCDCLMYAKGKVYFYTDKLDKDFEIMAKLVEKNPKNDKALLEQSLLYTNINNFPQAMDLLARAMECVELGSFTPESLVLMFNMASVLLNNHLYVQATGLLRLLNNCQGMSDEFRNYLNQMIMMVYEAPLSLRFKDPLTLQSAPDDFPEKEKYDRAVEMSFLAHWNESLALLKELEPLTSQWGYLYQAIIRNQLMLFDYEAAFETLDKFIALDNVKEEDRVDALILRQYLNQDWWGDSVTEGTAAWSINDFNSVLETLLSSPDFVVLDLDYSNMKLDDGNPPPQKCFFKLDKPELRWNSEEGKIKAEDLPHVQWNVLLYGRRTDREARIELIHFSENKVESAEHYLRNLLGNQLGKYEGYQSDPQPVSWVGEHLKSLSYYPKNYPVTEEEFNLCEQYHLEHVFCSQWLDHPLQLLNGKTPQEATQENSLRIPLLAAVELFTCLLPFGSIRTTVVTTLRKLLALPEPPRHSAENWTNEGEMDNLLKKLPSWRWEQIDISTIPSNRLEMFFYMAYEQKIAEVYLPVAQVILAQPAELAQMKLRKICYDIVIAFYSINKKSKESEEWLKKAYEEYQQLKISDSSLNLMELTMIIQSEDQSQFQRANELIRHLLAEHKDEPQVIETLRALMEQSQGQARQEAAPEGAMSGSGLGPQSAPQMPQAAEEKKTGLWTPDSPADSAPSNGSSKLWVPGE